MMEVWSERECALQEVEQILQQIVNSGVPEERLIEQIQQFEKGYFAIELDRPCTSGDGIVIITEAQAPVLLHHYRQAAEDGRLTQFVPASGAATRMFQSLLAVCYRETGLTAGELSQSGDADDQFSWKFFQNLTRFAFVDTLRAALSHDGLSLDACLAGDDYHTVLKRLLTPAGLNFGNLPKGLIPFHYYEDGSRTAFEEHLRDTVGCARDRGNLVRLHFTIAAEFHAHIAAELEKAMRKFDGQGVRFELTFSEQKVSTNTIAVTLDHSAFHDAQGRLVFRPAGHGALLENLESLQGDIVMIRNIDNVVPDHLKSEILHYKSLLLGYLVELQNRCFAYLNRLAKEPGDAAFLMEVVAFAREKLYIDLSTDLIRGEPDVLKTALILYLNRPLRVCGMVRNVGEPGGGPFWVRQSDGLLSLQIVEKSQIDLSVESQQRILASSTHFNPVDIVCGLRDYTGQPFKLRQYQDPNTGFITIKSKDGQVLKALELPGLWNGAMAFWNTVFVEMPLSTFNPVKTVNDLLRSEHQSPHDRKLPSPKKENNT